MPEDFPAGRIENNWRIMLLEETKRKGKYFHQYASYKVRIKPNQEGQAQAFLVP